MPFLLRGIFPTQGSNPGLLAGRFFTTVPLTSDVKTRNSRNKLPRDLCSLMAGSPPQPGPGGPTSQGQDEGFAHLSSLYPGDPRHSPRGSWASAERGGRAASPWGSRAGGAGPTASALRRDERSSGCGRGMAGLGTCVGPRVALRSLPLSTVMLTTVNVAHWRFCCGSRTVPRAVSRSSLYAQGPAGTSWGAGESGLHSVVRGLRGCSLG